MSAEEYTAEDMVVVILMGRVEVDVNYRNNVHSLIKVSYRKNFHCLICNGFIL